MNVNKERYHKEEMSQKEGVMGAFHSFFKEEKFDRVIEIGTWTGVLSLFLADIHQENFYTFDIKNFIKKDIAKRLHETSANIYMEDIFKTDKIQPLLEDKGRVLLLCDGGYKPKEIRKFAPMIKDDDIIMAHDYFADLGEWKKRQIWKCCEVVSKDFDQFDYLEKNEWSGLFEDYVWGLRVKRVVV